MFAQQWHFRLSNARLNSLRSTEIFYNTDNNDWVLCMLTLFARSRSTASFNRWNVWRDAARQQLQCKAHPPRTLHVWVFTESTSDHLLTVTAMGLFAFFVVVRFHIDVVIILLYLWVASIDRHRRLWQPDTCCCTIAVLIVRRMNVELGWVKIRFRYFRKNVNNCRKT